MLLESILIILIGMSTGSFITMASYRLTEDGFKLRDLVFQRSHCTNCKKQLQIKNLIPIFSWIFQKGKCNFCHKKISIRYLLTEVFTALIFFGTYLAFDKTIDAHLIITLLIITTALVMIVTDLEHYFIPDILQIIFLILAIIFHLIIKDKPGHDWWYWMTSGFYFAFFGMVINYIFLIFTKKHGIGIDDIKFFTIAGFLLGLDQFSSFMIFSGALGIIFGAVWIKLKKDHMFPFAPAIVASLIYCLTLGNKINYTEIFTSFLTLINF